MSDTVISVEQLSKYYRLGTTGMSGAGLRQLFQNTIRRMTSRKRNGAGHHADQHGDMVSPGFWALRDVDFEITRGQVVGVIGRNGAGKSTLLKVLSRIVTPTSGRALIHGRVASLLEVGTGFHPELSGRENIYLNGAILGMSKAEIDRRFDEIVAFAEVERFIDTPVKRYSSGMYVRLAFAVAAHLEPEILIIDEVLAVGDATFQRKCLGKMGEAARDGRTILFVSHNLSAVAALCNHAVMLDHGRLLHSGSVTEVASHYQKLLFNGAATVDDLDHERHVGSGKARCTSIRVVAVGDDDTSRPVLYSGMDLLVEVAIQGHTAVEDQNLQVILLDSLGYRIVDVSTGLHGEYINLGEGEQATISFRLRDLLLRPGMYLVSLWLGRVGIEEVDYIESAARLVVEADPDEVHSVENPPGVYQCRFAHEIRYDFSAHPVAREVDDAEVEQG
jgi:lipopolysaccharide transport system ATP-binding protein